MLQGRLFSYPDTHRHRLGPNHLQIPINCPYACKVSNQQRDGFMTVNGNSGNEPNYEPNSIRGASKAVGADAKLKEYYIDDYVARYPQQHPNSDYEQCGVFYRKVLSDRDRNNLISNIADHLSGARSDIQARMIDLFSRVDKDYGARVADALLKSKSAKL